MGFAIPINTAKEVLEDLIHKGKVVRPYLGVYMQNITPEIANYLDLPERRGALVTEVVPNSPAKKAGLLPKDVIYKLGNNQINDSEELRQKLREHQAGEEVTLEVIREQRALYLSVLLEEQP